MTGELNGLTDRQLVERVAVLAATERAATAALVAALAEFDARRLYLGAGCSSLFTYCTQVLRLSESAAYVRIEVARLVRRFPQILERLADGRLSLSTTRLLAPVLTAGSEARVLDAAAFKTKREVEQIVVAERPQAPVATIVRMLPVRQPQLVTTRDAPASPLAVPDSSPASQQDGRSSEPVAPTKAIERAIPPPVVRALAPEMYRVQFTLSREGHDRLRHAQDLLRHVNASGDIAAIFERALAALIAELEKTKFAATERPRAGSPRSARSRHISSAVKREVWARDDGQCAFVGTLGRCTERGFLEYHHVIPFADGGETSVENLQLRCAAHNAYESVLWSGADVARERCDGWLDAVLGQTRWGGAWRSRTSVAGSPALNRTGLPRAHSARGWDHGTAERVSRGSCGNAIRMVWGQTAAHGSQSRRTGRTELNRGGRFQGGASTQAPTSTRTSTTAPDPPRSRVWQAGTPQR